MVAAVAIFAVVVAAGEDKKSSISIAGVGFKAELKKRPIGSLCTESFAVVALSLSNVARYGSFFTKSYCEGSK